jgi:hypothetical protein
MSVRWPSLESRFGQLARWTNRRALVLRQAGVTALACVAAYTLGLTVAGTLIGAPQHNRQQRSWRCLTVSR